MKAVFKNYVTVANIKASAALLFAAQTVHDDLSESEQDSALLQISNRSETFDVSRDIDAEDYATQIAQELVEKYRSDEPEDLRVLRTRWLVAQEKTALHLTEHDIAYLTKDQWCRIFNEVRIFDVDHGIIFEVWSMYRDAFYYHIEPTFGDWFEQGTVDVAAMIWINSIPEHSVHKENILKELTVARNKFTTIEGVKAIIAYAESFGFTDPNELADMLPMLDTVCCNFFLSNKPAYFGLDSKAVAEANEHGVHAYVGERDSMGACTLCVYIDKIGSYVFA